MPALCRMPAILLLLLLPSAFVAEKSKCKVCRDLVNHFKEHFDKTTGHNFGGGNTAWEEKSLGTYATSETRLVEILEKTAKKCDYKCSSLLEDQEEYLEEWFFKRQETDLFEELCVDHLKRCCLKNRWGPDCAECPGGIDTPCSNHGKCQDEGDRESKLKSGKCTCDRGYNGTVCDSCKDKFVRVGDSCEECSTLCKSQNCTAPGPAGCVECRMGYEMIEGTGCSDIDECTRPGMGCGDPLEDCVNSAGSYECVCKNGYTRVNGKCQLEDLYASEDEEDDSPSEAEEEPDVIPSDTTMEIKELEPDEIAKELAFHKDEIDLETEGDLGEIEDVESVEDIYSEEEKSKTLSSADPKNEL